MVGKELKLKIAPSLKLSGSQLARLSEEFRIPILVFENLQRRLLTETSLDSAHLAAEIRATVVDYKYLDQRWRLYRPSSAGGAQNQRARVGGLAGRRSRQSVEPVSSFAAAASWPQSSRSLKPRVRLVPDLLMK